MPVPQATEAYDRRQVLLTLATIEEARRLWAQLTPRSDFDAVWARLGPQLLNVLTVAQHAAAVDAASYLALVLPEVGLPDEPELGAVNAAAFAGVASDGRDLGTLLEQPVIRAKTATAAGDATQGLAAGWSLLEAIVSTQLADASREAAQAGIVVRPRVPGYVRMLRLPSCSRCAILAGKWFRWNDGFRRHPRCDCRHIPAAEDAEDLRTDPAAAVASGQVTGLSQADQKALAAGADLNQVVNARRGMSTATVGGRPVEVTTEGTTKRGYASSVRRAITEQGGATARNVGPRLTPATIYQVTDSREDAVRLLVANGYVLPPAGSSITDLARTVA